MTEQEITQAREDLAQLDIEQLRCGVMLQLLKIEALTKERDALAAAGKLALNALDTWYYGANQFRPEATVFAALQALKKAGVQ